MLAVLVSDVDDDDSVTGATTQAVDSFTTELQVGSGFSNSTFSNPSRLNLTGNRAQNFTR